jgi:hypothetical protein
MPAQIEDKCGFERLFKASRLQVASEKYFPFSSKGPKSSISESSELQRPVCDSIVSDLGLSPPSVSPPISKQPNPNDCMFSFLKSSFPARVTPHFWKQARRRNTKKAQT